MRRHSKVPDPGDGNDSRSQNVQDLKAKSSNRKEVHGPGYFEVISQEGQPRLGLVRSSPSLDHILPDGVWAG